MSGPGWPAARHYLPVVIGLAAFALVVALVPSTEPTVTNAGGGSVPASATGPQPPAPDAPGSPGVAVSGVRCGPGVRQVSWSHYAPICQPAYHGHNGGATAPGVTGTTITLTYREAVSGEEQQLSSFLGPTVLPTNAAAVSVMQSYINLFNKDFELYGRHVVLKPFQGKGDFITEENGSGEAQAQEDADTAKAMGAFADVSLIASTPPYMQSLVTDKIIGIGGALQSVTIMRKNAPYQYEVSPDCQKAAAAGVNIIGRAMAGMKAIYAGDPALRTKTRVIAGIAPDSQSYNQCTGIVAAQLKKRYGVTEAVSLHYPLNLTGGSALAANTVAQLQHAGVTTVLCSCDPVTPIYLTSDANSLNFHPEWFTISFGDAFNRLPNQDQWAHAMAGGQALLPERQQEAYQAYQLAHSATPITPAYSDIYEPLLLFFDALQAAGPDLTPQNFQAGVWSLPPSLPGGMYGGWRFGVGTVDPPTGNQVLWWNPTALNPQDAKKGTFEPCNGAITYGFYTPPTLPLHRQLQCFANAPPVGPGGSGSR